MTINIKKDRIEFVSNEGTTYTLRETGDGFSFDGVIEGTNIFQDGFQGTVAGFVSGGQIPPAPTNANSIEKFPFASDSNSLDHGDLTQPRRDSAGNSSTTHGYASGGYTPSPGPNIVVNTIDKFLFSSTSNATDVGDLSTAKGFLATQSSSINGYCSGGSPPFPSGSNVIDKFPFTTDTNATDIGDLTEGRYFGMGQSSLTSGYVSGGIQPLSNTIDKFPFSSDTNATDVGDLTQARSCSGPQSSTTHGYTSGGTSPTNVQFNTIDKFPFAADANATDVGDLSSVRKYLMGQSSTSFGYNSGGYDVSPGPILNIIEKFPFSADSNATDVGDLTTPRMRGGGHQD